MLEERVFEVFVFTGSIKLFILLCLLAVRQVYD